MLLIKLLWKRQLYKEITDKHWNNISQYTQVPAPISPVKLLKLIKYQAMLLLQELHDMKKGACFDRLHSKANSREGKTAYLNFLVLWWWGAWCRSIFEKDVGLSTTYHLHTKTHNLTQGHKPKWPKASYAIKSNIIYLFCTSELLILSDVLKLSPRFSLNQKH